MDESSNVDKISLKQAQLSAQKFNEVAIPHHLSLLKNHKSNIEKYFALSDWSKIKKEEINAMRVIKQLKNLLYEMDTVRNKVKKEDIEKFDRMIESGKQKAVEGINEFLELQLRNPSSLEKSNDICSDDNDITEQFVDTVSETLPPIHADFEQEQEMLRMRESCLAEFEKLQQEIEDLNSMFHNFQNLVNEQGESVEVIATNAEEALENVNQGEVNLRNALKYKKAMYPVVGALIGTCIGGPIGLLAGIKAGSLAAVGCGILGFTGGSVLKSTEIINGTEIDDEKKET